MAIYIEITKISKQEHIGFYHVFTKHGGNTEFYIGIDKQNKKIYCYFEKDFSDIIRIIDCNDPNERVGTLPGVDSGIISRVIGKAFKVFKLDEYPQYLDYCA